MEQISPCFFSALDDGKYAVSYELTNICNMNCQHCMNKSGLNEFSGMDVAEVRQLLSEMEKQDIHFIYISGGDPLLHPQFEEIVKYAFLRGFQITLATNGLLIPDYIDVIKKYIWDVSISLDGIGDVHDEFRGKQGAFDAVMKSVRLLKEHGLNIRFSTALWKKSMEQLDEIVTLADKLKVSRINLSIIVPTGRTVENNIQIPRDMYPYIVEKVKRIQKERSEKSSLNLVLRRCKALDKTSSDCIGGNSIMHVDAHGRISPCSWLSKADTKNLYSMQWTPGNLKSCIEKCKSIEQLIEQRKLRFGFSGCAAIAYLQNGDLLSEDPINKMLRHEVE